MTKGTIEYEITDVDNFEVDAILKIGNYKFCFQFDPEKGPTIDEALKDLSEKT